MTVTKGFIHGAATAALDTRKADEHKIVTSAAGVVRTGVLTDNPSIVTADASTAPMRVAVAKAGFVTQRAAGDGVAIWSNDGSVFVPVTKPGSNSWYVVVWAKHNDTASGDGTNLPEIGTTTGTAAASPSVPSIPAGALELARILIPSSATATTSGGVVITNTYPMTAFRGGVVPLRDAAELAAWAPGNGGQAVTIADGVDWTRIGGAWDGVGWQSYTPAWGAVNSPPSIGNGSLIGRFQKIAPKTYAFRIFLTFGSTTSGGTGGWSFGLPPGLTSHASGEQVISAKIYMAGLAANFAGVGLILPGATALAVQMPVNSIDSNTNQVRNADASGAVNTGVPNFPGSYTFVNGANLVVQGVIETA